jgi:hypothetical protein
MDWCILLPVIALIVFDGPLHGHNRGHKYHRPQKFTGSRCLLVPRHQLFQFATILLILYAQRINPIANVRSQLKFWCFLFKKLIGPEG